MTSKLKTDVLETVSGSGTIALTNQLSGMTSASVPSGSVLQVVQATTSTQAATTSTAWSNMGLSVSITPTSSSSKVLAILNYVGAITTDNHLYVQITRGGTSIISQKSAAFAQSAGVAGGGYTLNKLDSPNTTSAITYAGQFHTRDSGENVLVQYSNSPSTITLMEIKG